MIDCRFTLYGSAHFEAPPGKLIYFQALDERGHHRIPRLRIHQAVCPIREGAQPNHGYARFDRIEHVPNTLLAHQLIYLAESQRKNQSRLA